MSLHCIVWCCRVLYCWLRRAGCISQDTYLLYNFRIKVYNHLMSIFIITMTKRVKMLKTNLTHDSNTPSLIMLWCKLCGVRNQGSPICQHTVTVLDHLRTFIPFLPLLTLSAVPHGCQDKGQRVQIKETIEHGQYPCFYCWQKVLKLPERKISCSLNVEQKASW